MCYNHILVAVDFAKGNQAIVDKAIRLAKSINAKVSLIHINNQITDEADFGGLIDTDLAPLEPAHPTVEELTKKLAAMASKIDYPIEGQFVVKGDLSHGMEETVKKNAVDLIICGHHHNLWSRLKPSARNLINTSLVDLLIIPLQD
ncbi:MAG: universal stress protein [Psychromonas sp.]